MVFWELELLKFVGYDLDLKNIVTEESINNKKIYFVANSNEKKYVPTFLVEKNYSELDMKEILNGLKLVNDYLDKSVLKPNNIPQPKSRLDFLNNIKK